MIRAWDPQWNGYITVGPFGFWPDGEEPKDFGLVWLGHRRVMVSPNALKHNTNIVWTVPTVLIDKKLEKGWKFVPMDGESWEPKKKPEGK